MRINRAELDETAPNRETRRGDGVPQPPVPARRGGKWGMYSRGDQFALPVNDMRPREVDRKAVKAKRKASAKARRKRK